MIGNHDDNRIEADSNAEQQELLTHIAADRNNDLSKADQTLLSDQTWSFKDLPGEIGLSHLDLTSNPLHNDDSNPGANDLPSTVWEQSAEVNAANISVNPSTTSRDEPDALVNTSSSSSSSKFSPWRGWAEIENDPEIFTILVHAWGDPEIQVNEIIDIAVLFEADPENTLGLILLSRYVPSAGDTLSQTALQVGPQPWFANQISKFSCGTVALMNILMNNDAKDLSKILSDFHISTTSLSSKDCGIALDRDARFRDIHNSFSTKLDRMIVDVLLKDDASKHKALMQAQARKERQDQKNGSGTASLTRKKRRKFSQKKSKKRLSDSTSEDEPGFHFVAFLPAHGHVWKLDGMQRCPFSLEKIDGSRTWLEAAAADLQQQMEEAFNSGQECSLMSVTRTPAQLVDQKKTIVSTNQDEVIRKQEDWAPFIECMLRLHAEKGDLQELIQI